MLVQFESSALLEEAVATIRDKNTPSLLFRESLRKIARYLIYEAAKQFPTDIKSVETPVARGEARYISKRVVVISILRAALPMTEAILDEFTNASLGIISASRGRKIAEDGTEFEIETKYEKLPPLNGAIVVLVDPMLATASTINHVLSIITRQDPDSVYLLSAIGSEYGVQKVENDHPEVQIYCAAIDKELNSHGYIVPGLGDAGDRYCNTPH